MTDGAAARVVGRPGLGRQRFSTAGHVAAHPAAAPEHAALAARFAAADPEAIRAVYERYGGLVFSVAHKVLGDVGLAEDAVQQTFVQAWRAAGTYDPQRAL